MGDNPLLSTDLELSGGLRSLWLRFLNRRFVVFLLSLLSGWLIISYIAVHFIAQKWLADELRRYAAELEQTAVAVSFHFDRSLSYLYIVPESVADNEQVRSALRTFAGQTGWRNAPPESKRAFLNSRRDLMSLNRCLEKERMELGVDILWVLADNGMRHSIDVAVRAQNDLKSLNESLGERISEEVRKSREKDHIMLQQDKMASIGQLAAGVAHEINNPIGFVSSNLGSLGKYLSRISEFIGLQAEKLAAFASPEISVEVEAKRKSLKLDYIIEDAGTLVRESLEGTDRVRKIVQDLKTFSRLDEEKYKCSDINECLESTINIVWNELKYKATIRKELGGIPRINCYPQQLSQVFMNLLVNASHAIENRGEIALRTWRDTKFINVSVEDNGLWYSGGDTAQDL